MLDKTPSSFLNLEHRGFIKRWLGRTAAYLQRLAGDSAPSIDSPAKQAFKISQMMLARANQKSTRQNPFLIPDFPPNVRPHKDAQMALDDSGTWASGQWSTSGYAGAIAGIFAEGLAFPGYMWLAEQAQRPETRKFAEILGTEMTREWIRLQSSSDDPKTDIINKINERLDHLRVRDLFRRCIELDELFGRSHLYIDTGASDNREELKTKIGNGRDFVSRVKVGKGDLKAFRVIEPVWCYPLNYESADPLKANWYEPETWFVMGKEVHTTRLLKFVGHEVPDILKPAYAFGGISMTQMSKVYVDNWVRTRQSVSDLLHAFSIMVLSTDMGANLTEGGEEMFDRIHLFNRLRDNRGMMLVNKDTEELTNVSAPLGGLHELQAQSQEQMCSIASIPVVKFLGIQPTGLNASDEGGIRMFYDWIGAQQEKRIRPNLTTVIDFIQLSEFGEIDDDITFSFVPLYSLDEKAEADKLEVEGRTAVAYIDAGVLAPKEVREALAGDPDSKYASIDVEDVPDLQQEEMGGLDPKAGGGEKGIGKPPRLGGGAGEGAGEEEAAAGQRVPPASGEAKPGTVPPGGAKKPPARQAEASGEPEEEEDESPFQGRVRERGERHARGEGGFYDRAHARSERGTDYLKRKIGTDRRPFADDEDWDEGKHKRDDHGKFSATGTGSKGFLGVGAKEDKPITPPDDVLKKWIQAAPKPTKEQKEEIFRYTSSGKRGGVPPYFRVNSALRRGEANELDAEHKKMVNEVRSYLREASFPENATAYRFVNPNYFKTLAGLKPGTTFQDLAFVSMTVNPMQTHIKADKLLPRLEVRIRKGAKAAYINELSDAPDEKEILCQMGSKMRVVKAAKDHIVVELVNA